MRSLTTFVNAARGAERIANELLLKLGLRILPRTVQKYVAEPLTDGPGKEFADQRRKTWVGKHTGVIVASDFFMVVTSTFMVLCISIVVEHTNRRILHLRSNLTLQQLREAIPGNNGIVAGRVTVVFEEDSR